MTDYNDMEMMISVASRELEDGASVGVGTGAPCAAAMLAQKMASPNLSIFFEAGGVSPQLPEMPISVGDSRTFYKAAMAGSMSDTMEACARGFVDYTFLGGAQIDPFGNLNSTVIGEHDNPKVRFPGSGGANDFASLCWRTMVMTPQNKKRFVETLDFLTTPGYLKGGNSREESGLPAGTGPYKIITNMAVMDFAPDSKRMRVISLNPDYRFEDVQDNCGFELLQVDEIQQTKPPTDVELKILREEVDPNRYVIGR
ncbi:MAG: 3-oxoacid CoA-transferase [Deltaproteobacteria bacterium]|jgi:glutaconate CoA-transferase, subunit B|nr:3-oxoacid CoA-transferase [Deltaproteobacteria bacterium]MBT4644055.1 3-oxoacid CoA-transferase [Deltaproteobacteria bacterium]MBT6503648.1 3-oxoacid CoA-transferase [Deltaproteobacteria bacterium]MBT7152699.1 3-oxoacid CoA-transferase [Deltaproteobacteria bacterium]MBT7713483.1 3-oxoacid CoA-transferase [Deltaproteobacteria bacterium]